MPKAEPAGPTLTLPLLSVDLSLSLSACLSLALFPSPYPLHMAHDTQDCSTHFTNINAVDPHLL